MHEFKYETMEPKHPPLSKAQRLSNVIQAARAESRCFRLAPVFADGTPLVKCPDKDAYHVRMKLYVPCFIEVPAHVVHDGNDKEFVRIVAAGMKMLERYYESKVVVGESSPPKSEEPLSALPITSEFLNRAFEALNEK